MYAYLLYKHMYTFQVHTVPYVFCNRIVNYNNFRNFTDRNTKYYLI